MTSTVVITGANRGLGLELARAYAAAGHRVIGGCRNPSAATDLAKVAGRIEPLDTGDHNSIRLFCAALSGEHIDVLINNAGIDARALGAPDNERDIFTLSGDHILGEVNVNAVGPLLVARGLLDGLRKAGNAKIVNVSSQIGSMIVSATMGRDVGYAISKAALNMVTVKMAWQLKADNITATALHPGYLRTGMGGDAAPLGPDEAAAAIVGLIAGLTLENSGQFLRWDGTEHPW